MIGLEKGASMKFVLVVIVAWLTAGCYGYDVTVRSAPLSPGAYPPPNKRFVEIYFHNAGPAKTKDHEQICVLEVTGARYTPLSELIFELRQKAASIGADAVIVVKDESTLRVEGNILLDIARTEGYQRESYGAIRLSGIAIKYR
jgi:hypothetical protein